MHLLHLTSCCRLVPKLHGETCRRLAGEALAHSVLTCLSCSILCQWLLEVRAEGGEVALVIACDSLMDCRT